MVVIKAKLAHPAREPLGRRLVVAARRLPRLARHPLATAGRVS
jgi:hypothetical protein